MTFLTSYSKVPHTEEEWKQIARDFYDNWQFPNCIGALDGKHIAIRCPQNSGSLYFNYKKTFSLVLMALADANYKLIYIDVGCKGRISDGGVFNRSSLFAAIENNVLRIPPPCQLPSSNIEAPFVIVADDAFALKTYLMKPFSFRGQDRSEHIYNYRLSRARRMVESTFGLMAAKFRLLRSTIELSEKNAKLCTLAICVLHNWLLTINPNVNRTSLNVTNVSDNPSTQISSEQNATNDAKNVRERFKNYFVSPEGEIFWQYEMV